MQKITTFFWFNDRAEEAAKLYVSLFRNSRIGDIGYYSKENEAVSGFKPGSVMVVNFTLDGQDFIALNGGPHYKLNEAASLQVACEDQAEVDRLWDTLCEGGTPSMCGWLTDRFGLTWQIVPKAFHEMMRDKNPKKTGAVTAAMLQMKKFDIARLKQAYDAA